MKRSHALVLATTLALALAAALGQTASAAVSRQSVSPGRSTLARGKIGTALPSAGAAARIRALGLDDSGGGLGSDDGGGLGSDDGGVLTAGGHAAHGTIGSAGPSPHAAGRIAALGLDD
jgi:hypothetical protein